MGSPFLLFSVHGIAEMLPATKPQQDMSTAIKKYNIGQKALAWSVHLFTAGGLLAGFMAILAINEKDWRTAMFWLIACQFIDGIDGTFARLFKVKEVLPNIDGKTIDQVIDFATYALIPAYFFYMAGLVDGQWKLGCAFLILLVSAIYYGKEGMVSDDMYFVGFPVMWNMVLFYMVFVFVFPAWANVAVIVVLAILHFIPIKFPYPSRAGHLKWLTLGVTLAFLFSMLLTVFLYPERHAILTWMAITTVVYFGGVGVWVSFYTNRRV